MIEQKNFVSRQTALAEGMEKYFTGIPCKHGHISERYTKHRSCIQCLKKAAATNSAKQWMREHNKKRRQKPEYIELEKKIRSSDKAKKRKLEYNKTERMRKWRNEWQKNRINNDPLYAMRRRISTLIGMKISAMGYSKTSKVSEILGCSWDEFMSHIERQFYNGMSWDNRDKWHIDHIIPASSASSEREIISLSHYTNLRPLWEKENLAKSDRLDFLI